MANERIYCKLKKIEVNKKYWPGCKNNFNCDSCHIPPAKRKQPERKALEEWVKSYWLPFPFRLSKKDMEPTWENVDGEWRRISPSHRENDLFDDSFYDGSFREIRERLGVKRHDDLLLLREQLLRCSYSFGEWIDFYVRTIPSKLNLQKDAKKLKSIIKRASCLEKKEDATKQLIGLEFRLRDLSAKKRLNAPLDEYVFLLAIIWEKWTRREVRRLNKPEDTDDPNQDFYDFISYCITSMDLWRVWGMGSIKKAVQRVIHNYLLPIRDHLKKKYPSISLGDLDPAEFLVSMYLWDSVSQGMMNPVHGFQRPIQ